MVHLQRFVVVALWLIVPSLAQAARPNVVLILIDDLSHYCVTVGLWRESTE